MLSNYFSYILLLPITYPFVIFKPKCPPKILLIYIYVLLISTNHILTLYPLCFVLLAPQLTSSHQLTSKTFSPVHVEKFPTVDHTTDQTATIHLQQPNSSACLRGLSLLFPSYLPNKYFLFRHRVWKPLLSLFRHLLYKTSNLLLPLPRKSHILFCQKDFLLSSLSTHIHNPI